MDKQTKVKNQLRCLLRAGAIHPPKDFGLWTNKGLAWLSDVDRPERFARVNRVPAYFGLVPSQDASAGVNRLGHITKQGPATARKLLVQASWQMVRRDPATRDVFGRIVAGKKERRKTALVALAHRLVRTMHAMLRSGEVYRPTPAQAPDILTPPEATTRQHKKIDSTQPASKD